MFCCIKKIKTNCLNLDNENVSRFVSKLKIGKMPYKVVTVLFF